jgi:hypothetical protein
MSNQSLFIGIELMSNKTTANTLNPNFYDRAIYLHSSYDGRRWGAHSGSDSDDKIIMLGYLKNDLSIITAFKVRV